MSRVKSPASSRSNPFPAILPATSINVAYLVTAVTSAAMAAGVSCVRLIATTAVHIRIGANPTALTTDTLLPANVPEYFMVNEGDKISAIRDAADGTLYITPATKS